MDYISIQFFFTIVTPSQISYSLLRDIIVFYRFFHIFQVKSSLNYKNYSILQGFHILERISQLIKKKRLTYV